MYAVIESGSKQYRVEPGMVVEVDRLSANPGEEVVFDRVLLASDGRDVSIGTPVVDGARVTGEVVGQHRSRKIVVFKYKPKQRYRVRGSQRRAVTRVRITGVSV
ncbi:MAG: 50S ribosomal protein L21 [Anaerolineae bacterium]|nr:50S ribosomal protein L21 [Anaerolineae bacterium]